MDANGVVVPEETEDSILGLFGKYRALSNFHEAPITVGGLTYHTSEAAYMAEKTDVLEEKLHLTGLKTGKEAKEYGRKVTLRSDWEAVKLGCMFKVLMAKFEQNRELASLLLSTRSKYIEETNWWNDTYWGVCGGEGLNALGATLMAVREHLMVKIIG